MNSYSLWAAFGFLFLLALGFAFFLTHLSPEIKEETKAAPQRAIKQIMTGTGLTAESFALLKLAYYSILSLILLQVFMILLLII